MVNFLILEAHMHIALYRPEFRDELLRVHEDCFREIKFAPIKLEGRDIFVAMSDEDELVGYVLGCVHENSYYIEWLGVLSKYRGMALGRYLLESSIDQAKNYSGVKDVVVHSRHRFSAALSLYESFGFKQVRTYTNEMDGEEMLVYVLEIASVAT